MSKLIVEVCPIAEVKPHSNADLLEIVVIKGWQVVVQKSLGLKTGDPVIYFPPDTMMPESLADRLGIKKYLSPVNGERPGFRVRAARLRGEPSFGTIDHEVKGFAVAQDVADSYGVWKYEPPIKCQDGDALPEVPGFHKYTDIENIRNFPGILQEGEEVVITEKIHGKNCRMGLIRVANPETGEPEMQFVAGSREVRRKPFDAKGNESDFWRLITPEIRSYLSAWDRNVVIFGEIYGSGVQDMQYGLARSQEFRAFDVSVGGTYLDFDRKRNDLEDHRIPMVPILYRGPFSMEVVNDLTDGPTWVCDPALAGKFKGREGIVITPVVERHDPAIDRVILKSVSVDYLSRKGGTDD